MKEIFGKILLASNSPRRFHLLSEAGFEVEVVKGKGIEERYPEDMPPEKIPAFLSELKATPYKEMALQRRLPLVAADTIVILGGEPIGKPSDKDEAIDMLKKLSGREHEVVSGVTVIFPDKETVTFSEKTSVRFSKLDENLIRYYVENENPLDKAGSYGVQDFIGLVGVESIKGDYYNIMGFPVCSFVKQFLLKYPSFLPEKI